MFIKTAKQIIRSVKVAGKPLSIHCEVQHIPRFQIALRNFLSQHKKRYGYAPILYCLTPLNKAYIEGFFGRVNENFDKQLEKAYLDLQRNGYPIQLHVHLTFKSNLLSLKEKKEVVSNAYKWMRDTGLHPTELVLGWWCNEKEMENIGSQLNLRLVKKDEYRVLHDYELLDLK